VVEIEWLTLPADAPIVGQRLDQSAIRVRAGASIVALVRDGIAVSNPWPEEILQAGQSIAIVGTAEQRLAFRGLLIAAHTNPTDTDLRVGDGIIAR
jgi:CPA2 family monovalent cation:H+ antiporter-2